jgi:hypothetical protein
MDGSRFDAWTRRRFGFAIGGATLVGLHSLTAGEAAKNKKRCKKLGKPCSPGGRKCCKKLKCREKGEIDPQFRCCRPDGQPCTSSDQCCNGCNLLEGPGRCEAA